MTPGHHNNKPIKLCMALCKSTKKLRDFHCIKTKQYKIEHFAFRVFKCYLNVNVCLKTKFSKNKISPRDITLYDVSLVLILLLSGTAYTHCKLCPLC